jgi:hypothetical protein
MAACAVEAWVQLITAQLKYKWPNFRIRGSIAENYSGLGERYASLASERFRPRHVR